MEPPPAEPAPAEPAPAEARDAAQNEPQEAGGADDAQEQPEEPLPHAAPRARSQPSKSLAALGVPVAAALGSVLVAGVLAKLLRRKRKPTREAGKDAKEVAQDIPAAVPTNVSALPPHVVGVDLSPFGSPVGGTPARLQGLHDKAKQASAAADSDDQSDNASVRDQRHGNGMDAGLLQKTLKQMQDMQEENQRLSAFLTEYKTSTDKLAKLEQENNALREVTRSLEQELLDLKSSALLPRSGAELEVFKAAVRSAPATALSVRSACSTEDAGAGATTASVDGTLDARVRRTGIFKQLLANLHGGSSAGTSQPTTPRGTSGGGGAASKGRRPGPEETAAIGQAVFQLLDHFSAGRMM